MSLLTGVGRYYRTVRHLKPEQLWTRLVRRATRPRIPRGPRPVRREPAAALLRPIDRGARWSGPDRVNLINIERQFEHRIDWNPADAPRLWVYELNYFADLPSGANDGSREWMSQIVDSWIDANPPGTPVTWDPYPVSLRIVNWIKWVLLREAAGAGGAAPGRVLDSLALQARRLERGLEFDIAANHLFANAAALAAAGLFFGGEEGDRWALRGFSLLTGEIEEQVLNDGGHYERSPMYHAVVLEQILDVLNLCRVFEGGVPEQWAGRLCDLEWTALAMLEWLAAMTHPDGDIAFFNDAALGSAPTCTDLTDYAERIGLEPARSFLGGIQWLEQSDYFRLTSDDGRTVAIFDAGRIGPDHQPGHAHCDTLSVELSRDGERLLVNSGTSTYEPGPERSRQRSTAAHNTLRIDGEEQSEMWGSHRVGRRADLLHAGRSGNTVFAAHDGYRFLRGGPAHGRRIEMSDAAMTIVDEIEGRGEHQIEWFFHLHPDVAATVSGARVELSRGDARVGGIAFPDGVRVSVEPGEWHPGFSLSVPNLSIAASWRGSLPSEFTTIIEWT